MNALDPPHWTPNSYFGAFQTVHYRTNFGAKRDSTGAISAQVRATKSRPKFSPRTHLIHHIGPQTHVLESFGPFHYYTNFGAKWGELVQQNFSQ
jgi:hypothetical protein